MAELVDAPGWGPGGRFWPWRFDSSRAHKTLTILSGFFVFLALIKIESHSHKSGVIRVAFFGSGVDYMEANRLDTPASPLLITNHRSHILKSCTEERLTRLGTLDFSGNRFQKNCTRMTRFDRWAWKNPKKIPVSFSTYFAFHIYKTPHTLQTGPSCNAW